MNRTILNENLLQYIWQFKYFNTADLQTADGEKIEIIFPGTFNTNQGPDFLNAKINIAGTVWAGNVEIHIPASDWNKHKHAGDANYKNVILHVVWKNDVPIKNNIPVLELEPYVSGVLLCRYKELMQSQSFIPCQNQINTVPKLTWLAWKERLLAERLQKKSSIVFEYLKNNNHNWEESFWWLLAKNFGAKTNSEAFESMAQNIPVTVLAKHKNQLHQLEALLLGVSGLLQDNFNDDYALLLQKEFLFLQKKYQLQLIKIPVHFLRMRPSNFPTIRLAQLAVMIQNSHHLFSKILETVSVKEAKKMLHITANDYWHYRYRFDEPASFRKKNLGSSMAENIIINTFIPTIFAWGLHHRKEEIKTRAIQWLENLNPEKNSITNGFEKLNLENKSAFDSQALIELKNNYCNKKMCLNCAIGNKLLKVTNYGEVVHNGK